MTTSARTLLPEGTISQALQRAGVSGEVTEVENENGYDYLAAGDVAITWYQRHDRYGTRLVFELDHDSDSVSDMADTPRELLELLSRTLKSATSR